MPDPSTGDAHALHVRVPAMQRKPPVRKRLLRLSTSNGALAMLDQAVTSGGNFVTTLILLRYLSGMAAGYYTLIFAVLLGINAIQSALITAPLMVLAPRFTEERYGRYCNSLWAIQILGGVLMGIAAFVVVVVVQAWQPAFGNEVGALPLVLVVVTYLGQEFVRRLFFVQNQGLYGLCVDVISYGCQFLAIVALIMIGRLSLSSTVWAMGLTSLAAGAYGVFRLRPTLSTVTRDDLKQTWQQQWQHGVWLLGSAVAQWTSNQLYLFVVGGMLSIPAAAVFNAGRQLLGFLHIFLYGLESFVPALVTRRLVQGGSDAMIRWMRMFRIGLVTITGAYCVGVAVFADPLVQLVLRKQYDDIGYVVGLLAIGQFITSFTILLLFGLRAMEAPRWIFWARCAAAVVTVIIAGPLVSSAGLTGAALGMTCTYAITYIVIRIGYTRTLRAVRAHEVQARIAAHAD